MNEYFKTKAKFRKCYEDDTENNYSGLVDGAIYDISIKFGTDKAQIPTKEMDSGFCAEIITIRDINTNKTYKYASFNDAFNTWNINEYEETLLNEVDNRHNTYKRWYGPAVYVIATHLDGLDHIFEYLCETVSCIPVLANMWLDCLYSDEEYYKGLSIEINKVLTSQYVIMGNTDGEMTKMMKMMESVANSHNIPIIYTEDPTISAKESSKSNNVSIESSDNIKFEDLDDSLDN